MLHNDQGPQCPPKPLRVDSQGNLSTDEEIAGEGTLPLQVWIARQEGRLARGLPIETPPPLG